jgi:uncharacterized protein
VSAEPASRFHAADGRLHVWLRILSVLVVVLVAVSVANLPRVWLEGPAAELTQAATLFILAIGSFAWLTKRLDRRPVVSYGLRNDRGWWTDLLAGLFIGLLVGVVALLVLLAGGWTQITGVGAGTTAGEAAAALGAAMLLTVAAATWEELVFRGHLISNVGEAFARRRPPRSAAFRALLLSVLLFALLHAPELAAAGTAPPLIGIAHLIAMAALFGVAYIYTGQLGLPLGIHIGHNLAIHHLLGLHGELADESRSVLAATFDGPHWIIRMSGSAQLLGAAAGALSLWIWLKWRHQPIGPAAAITQPAPQAQYDAATSDN